MKIVFLLEYKKQFSSYEFGPPLMNSIFVLYDFEDKIDPILHFTRFNQAEDYITAFRTHHDNIIIKEIEPNGNGGRTLQQWQWLRHDKEIVKKEI